MSGRSALRAAVVEPDDPRAPDCPRVIPENAQRITVGRAHSLPASPACEGPGAARHLSAPCGQGACPPLRAAALLRLIGTEEGSSPPAGSSIGRAVMAMTLPDLTPAAFGVEIASVTRRVLPAR